MKNTIRIGTRGSNLALIQAEMVKSALLKKIPHIAVEIFTIKTKGDKILDTPLASINDKGLFIKEIEEALINNEIDIAVHSLKDVPTEMPKTLTIGAVLERAEVKDVLLANKGEKLDQLRSKAIIATSSLRRKAQLLNYNKKFKIINIRGNIDTRINKLKTGYCDALVLAGAGVIRSGYEEKISEYLKHEIMMPAVCQGIIGVEYRIDDLESAEYLKAINHEITYLTARAESAFLRHLKGGCQIPIGCFSTTIGDLYKMEGMISDLRGKKIIKKAISGPFKDAVILAVELAELILKSGGEDILKDIRDEK